MKGKFAHTPKYNELYLLFKNNDYDFGVGL